MISVKPAEITTGDHLVWENNDGVIGKVVALDNDVVAYDINGAVIARIPHTTPAVDVTRTTADTTRPHAEIAEAADEMFGEICDDIAAGLVPPLIDSFDELQEYVDANTYGGFCDDDRRADWSTPDLIATQQIVDTMMKADRARRMAPHAVITVSVRLTMPEQAEHLAARIREVAAQFGGAQIVGPGVALDASTVADNLEIEYDAPLQIIHIEP
jgi:hypothetical protein